MDSLAAAPGTGPATSPIPVLRPSRVRKSFADLPTERALELEAQILMKATRVDGVYSDDPEKNPHAVLFRHLTFQQVRDQNLYAIPA